MSTDTLNNSTVAGSELQDIGVLGPWHLMWRRFKKHRIALFSLYLIVAIYLVALLAEFIAPMDPNDIDRRAIYHPPQGIHLFHNSETDGFSFGPYAYAASSTFDQETLARIYTTDRSETVELQFFAKTEPYKLMGFIPLSRILLGPKDPKDKVHLLGADRLGRDVFSRLVHGTRVSMSIGLIGVSLSLLLGITLGGISGYFGGWIDSLIQRLIELLLSIPTIPLWMGLAATIPLTWSPLTVYFIITLILSLVGWTTLARQVRGKFISLKNEDFVVAARLDGVPEFRIIMGHMVPSFSSHIIASVTLAIPVMIISETALSFLGIGLRSPVVSWGVLLQESQNIRSIVQAPWLFTPGIAVVVAVLAFNFMGDGMRDAADPYKR
tara:strand:+ start:4569 stop:5711 length:1143 start_codon:yes stop_codon:yes gene_type:complete